MLRSYLKFLIRVFLKDKFFSSLNILGLALGISVSIILLLILQHDLNYDTHYPGHTRIFRLGCHLQATGVDFRISRSARELATVLEEELPEVQATTRANNWDHTLIKYQRNGEDVAVYEENVIRTDSTYFKVFKHQFLAGDEKTCLKHLRSVVLTSSTASRYFGETDPIGQQMVINGTVWKVTAVIQDLPPNTHLKFDILMNGLISREWVIENGQVKSEAFWNPDVYTYLLMTPDYDPETFYSKFPAIFNKYFKSFGDQVGGKYTPILQPLADIHFQSDMIADEPVGNLSYLYTFTAIGLFIILLASINYMNLATAKAAKRAPEIAMKKTLGSGKRLLLFSFLGESVLLSMISLLLAILIVALVLNTSTFNSLIGRNLSTDFLTNPALVIGCVVIALVIGIISGLYPALYLPNIPTLNALKGTFRYTSSGHLLRKGLILTQFIISMFVVACTIFMKDQIDYMRDKDMGFHKENIVVLPIEDTVVQSQIGAIKNQMLQNPKITSATTAYNVLGMRFGGPVMWAESESGMKQQQFNMISVGEDYFRTLGIEVIKGREFMPGMQSDQNTFICNEAAARLMQWGDDPVGKKVKWFHAENDGQIIGMVKDFNYRSLHMPVEPLLIVKSRPEGGYLHLKVSSENLPETMNFIKKTWTTFDQNHPYEFFFLDQRFDEQYQADQTQHKLLTGLSYICIFISLLGLLGLSAFAAAQRTKEIGIRKVHGASVPGIIFLLYKDVMYLVILAGLIVVPIAYFAINQWRGNFAYQTGMNYLIFVVVAVLSLVFAFLTIAFHSLRTARTNPVKSLKYE